MIPKMSSSVKQVFLVLFYPAHLPRAWRILWQIRRLICMVSNHLHLWLYFLIFKMDISIPLGYLRGLKVIKDSKSSEYDFCWVYVTILPYSLSIFPPKQQTQLSTKATMVALYSWNLPLSCVYTWVRLGGWVLHEKHEYLVIWFVLSCLCSDSSH